MFSPYFLLLLTVRVICDSSYLFYSCSNLVSESDIFIFRLGMSSEKLRQQFEGQLCKYTNVVKGWQFRWFVLDPETGVLDYYLVSL